MADQIPASRLYDISDLYNRAFGHVRPPYPNIAKDLSGLSPVGTVKAILNSFQKESLLGSEFTFPVKLNGYQLPAEPTIGIRGGKRLVKTPVTRSKVGRKINSATVIEEVGMNPYEVRIRGIMFTDDDTFPENQIQKIREIVEQLDSVEIVCGLTAIFNITRIMIEDWRLFDVAGSQGQVQAYELAAIDDKDPDLTVFSNAQSPVN